jgi:rfaE bifunctional protein nucleotidyltransferase chain/domain
MTSKNPKIKTRPEISRLVNSLKFQNKTIVTINGSFDILHLGHIKMLEEAKKQGDYLFLGLNSDESVRKWKKYQKNKDWYKRPINSENARAEFLSAIKYVDYIEIFNEITPISFLENIKPHVHVNGSDYGKKCVEAPVIEKYNGKIHIAKFLPGYSSSTLIDKIIDIYSKKNQQ